MTPQYRQSFIAALTGHLLLVLAAVVMSVLPGCRRHKPVDLSAFDNIDITKIESFNKLERIKPPSDNVIPPPPPPLRTPPDVPDPKVPDDPVPVKQRPPDPVPVKLPEPAEGSKPDRAPPHDTVKPTPVKPPPVASNRTANASVPVIKSDVRVVRLQTKPGAQRPVPTRPNLLTPGALDPMPGIAAPLGASNSVPMDERQRCLLLIKKALYDVWDRPTLADAGRQPALLQLRFDAGGRVVGYQIARSSGSEGMDRSVLLAAKSVVRVDGLTPGFLNEFSTLTVEFTVTE